MTWAFQKELPGVFNSFDGLYMVDTNTGYIVGTGSRILKTVTGGN